MAVFHSTFKTVALQLLSVIIISGLLSGCASSRKYPPLERARAAYIAADANPEVKADAPVAFYEAGKALEKAEQAKDLEEKRHLSYLAEKKVEIAVAMAEQKKTEKEIEVLKWEEERAILESRRIESSDRETRTARAEAMKFKTEADRLKFEAETKAREADEAQGRAAQLESELSDLKAVKTDRGMVLTLGDVLFASGKAELAVGAKQTIDNLAAFLDKYPDRKVVIEGHTDSTGSTELNLDLSERRAQSVKIALLERGISFDRIDAVGFGEDKPIADNATPEGRQQNRRVEIIILNPDEPAALKN
jgi:outer membrane protein OmpA-like peptidoglycan-associated protein